MVHVLFVLNVLATVGTLLLPIASPTRGRAVWSWLTNLLAGGAISLVIDEHYPSWEEPAWHTGTIWALIAWAFLIVGFIVAVRKPRKNSVPAT